jgi:hypothetical protein
MLEEFIKQLQKESCPEKRDQMILLKLLELLEEKQNA